MQFFAVFENMEHLSWTEMRYLLFFNNGFYDIATNFHTQGMKKSMVFPVILSTGLTYLTVFEPEQNIEEEKNY